MMLALVASHEWEICEMDGVTAPLTPKFDEDTCVAVPSCVGLGAHRVCKQEKSPYGLRQALPVLASLTLTLRIRGLCTEWAPKSCWSTSTCCNSSHRGELYGRRTQTHVFQPATTIAKCSAEHTVHAMIKNEKYYLRQFRRKRAQTETS